MPDINLRNGKTLLMDAEEYEKAQQYKWATIISNGSDIVFTRIKKKRYYFARLIFGLNKNRRVSNEADTVKMFP